MKKLFALLLALVMLFTLSATAMAEEAKGSDDTAAAPKTLSWFTARRGIQQAELTGVFYQIQDFDIDIWVPDLLQPVEEVSENTFCAFEAENKGAVRLFWINGFDTLVLETKSEDSLSVIIMITDGGAMEFAFAPISNPDVYSLASLVMSTIQHHTLDVEDVALMIDADLNSFWTQDKNVTYSDDDKDRSIHIAMWEDGVNAETIKDINNWDEVKNARIGLYNDYMDAFDGLGVKDIALGLDYISEDQDVTFLTLENGEVTYDAFADAA